MELGMTGPVIPNILAMYGYIYKTTNLINNKIYIGQHKATHHDPEYLGSGSYLKTAIEKHGKENFTNEVIAWCETRLELNELESKYIVEHNSVDSKIGYNLTSSSVGGTPLRVTMKLGDDVRIVSMEEKYDYEKSGWIRVVCGKTMYTNKATLEEKMFFEDPGGDWIAGSVKAKKKKGKGRKQYFNTLTDEYKFFLDEPGSPWILKGKKKENVTHASIKGKQYYFNPIVDEYRYFELHPGYPWKLKGPPSHRKGTTQFYNTETNVYDRFKSDPGLPWIKKGQPNVFKGLSLYYNEHTNVYRYFDNNPGDQWIKKGRPRKIKKE